MHAVCSPYSDFNAIWHFISMAVFGLDMIISFRVAYLENDILVTEVWDIAKRYLRCAGLQAIVHAVLACAATSSVTRKRHLQCAYLPSWGRPQCLDLWLLLHALASGCIHWLLAAMLQRGFMYRVSGCKLDVLPFHTAEQDSLSTFWRGSLLTGSRWPVSRACPHLKTMERCLYHCNCADASRLTC